MILNFAFSILLKIFDPFDYESIVWSDDEEIYAYSLTESYPDWVDENQPKISRLKPIPQLGDLRKY
jgi:hypothetical protein